MALVSLIELTDKPLYCNDSVTINHANSQERECAVQLARLLNKHKNINKVTEILKQLADDKNS